MTATMSDYQNFIEQKHKTVQDTGVSVSTKSLPKKLFPWQKKVTAWALKRGRAALFLNMGLGKTAIQLAWADQVAKHTGKPVLILCPLAVGPQTVSEAIKFGVGGVELWKEGSTARIQVVNYHKLHLIDTSAYGGVVLDESSILKAYTGKIKRQLCEAFMACAFRLACTATPAPNDHMELGNHSQFLGVMDSDEMIARWFINDLSQAGVYRLKHHAAEDFWRWVTTWAVCASLPSDLGGDDTGYDLPPIEVFEHYVETSLQSGDGHLFEAAKISATTLHKEKRSSASARAKAIADVVRAEPDEPWIIWCDTDYEAAELRKVLPEASEVAGSMSDAKKEDGLTGFTEGRIKWLITKPTLAGFGLNWQHCAHAAFIGLSFSWEQFHQAIGRTRRFGQLRVVHVHIACAESESQIMSEIKRKATANLTMRSAMVDAVKSTWSENIDKLELSRNTTGRIERGNNWELRHGDCVQLITQLEDNKIGFSIFSPPFSNLYIYSDSAYDMGNAVDDDEFYKHFSYLVPELLRVTIPGRLCAVHCKDLPKYCGRDGVAGLKDFPGAIVRLFESSGWTFHSRVTIWKCPVVEMERTKNHGLLHKTVRADSSAVRQGMADYLMVFRKPCREGLLSDEPIVRPTGFDMWPGDPKLDPRENDYHPSKYARKGKFKFQGEMSHGEIKVAESIKIWQRLADPVWFHIDQQDVLNYQLGKDSKDEKHICPLQLGLIREAVYLWSNPGDTVLSVFAGVGSEGHESVKLGRKFIGFELKESYLNVAVKNLITAEKSLSERNLFSDIVEEETDLANA